MATITSIGNNSGLDINKIITDLMAAERKAPTQRLDAKEAAVQAKLSGIGTLKGALSDFQSAVASINSATQFQSLSATASDGALFSATTTSVAQAGNYDVTITKLAQAHKLVTSENYRFDNVSDIVGTGTLTFAFGAVGGPFTAKPSITIDASNNTLAGVRDAINKANIGVRANIVNDGSGYRLSISATHSGADNSLKITVADGDSNNTNQVGLSRLAYDPAGVVDSGKNMTQTLAAQDAELTVDGLAITSASNDVVGVVPGVTLTLKKADPATPATLTIAQDTAAASKAVDAFVTAYNKLMETNKSLTFYNAGTGQGGALLGNSSVRSIINQVRSILTDSVTGSTGTLRSLADAGVSLKRDGVLELDSGKLNAALASDPQAVAGLFARVTRASDSLITASSASKTSTPGTYGVSIAQLATQAQYSGIAIGAGPFNIATGSNDAVALTVNGKAVSVTLSPNAAYTGAALASELQSKINSNTTLASAGITVSVSYSTTQQLVFTTNTYGSASSIQFTQDNATLGISASQEKASGRDVAGSIGGVTATGVGQKLTGAGPAAGISLTILGGAIGSRGTVSLSDGAAYRLDSLLSDFLGSDGLISNQTESLNKEVEQITGQRASLEARMNALEARYTAQFRAMDTLLGKLNQTSTFLTQQLAANNKSTN